MDESNYYLMNGRHIPAFGSWDCGDDDFPIPFTQCFESARQAGLLRYSYSEDHDLYDLYHNDIVTPAMIVVPSRKRKGVGKEEGRWVVCNSEYEYDDYKETVKEISSPVPSSSPPARKITSKAVDEDLYKISPALLYSKQPKRKGMRGLFSRCLRPTCVS